MRLSNPLGSGPLLTCTWKRREPGGIYVGHNRQVWMYRELPLTPLQWEDERRRIEVGSSLETLLHEIGEQSRDLGQGMRSLSRNRNVHVMMISYTAPTEPSAETPDALLPFLSEVLPQWTSRKTLLVGVQLVGSALDQIKNTRGSILDKGKAFIKAQVDDGEGPLDAFSSDWHTMDAIFRRNETFEPSDEALRQLEAWFDDGVTPDAPLAVRSESVRNLTKNVDYEISAVMRFEHSRMTSPGAQWLLDAATHPDPAIVISVRAELEPSAITRTRLRRQRRKLIEADEQERATEDIGREENESNLSLAEELESFVRRSGTAWLVNTSILMVRQVSKADDTYADMLRTVYGIETKVLGDRQLKALSEMQPCSPARANPFPQDINASMIGYGGLAAFSNLGDDTGVFQGYVDPDYVPALLDVYGASKHDKPPVMGVFGDPGSGKAQPLSARILTPAGWRLMGEMKVGDEVIGRDGNTHRVLGVYPQGVKPIYRINFNDGSSTEATGDHLWSVATSGRIARGYEWQTRTTDELRAAVLDGQGKRQWRVPVVEPVNFEAATVPVDPYLLGVLLGDGNLTHFVNFSSADIEIVDSVRSAVAPLKVKPLGRYDYQIAGNGPGNPHPLRQQLVTLGVWGLRSYEKHIPAAYLTAPIKDRRALLQGLLDTDGECTNANSIVYSTSSEQLAHDVRALVQSLGGVARLTSKIPSYVYKGERKHGRRSYRLSIMLPADQPPFRLRRKADALRPRTRYNPSRSIAEITYVRDDQAQCIAVSAPDKLYVTDDFIVTHNTFACQLLAGQAAIAGDSAIFVNPKSADTLTPWANWVASQGAPVQIINLKEMQEQGGAFDPFRFADPAFAAEILSRHILTVVGRAFTDQQEIKLRHGINRGALAGARCAAEALAYVDDPEVVATTLMMADASPLFALGFGRVPQEPWHNQGGLTLIEFGRDLPLPKPGKAAADYEMAEREGVAAMRLISRAAVEILIRANGGVLVVDEAHHFLGSEEGLSTLDRLAREGRSMGLLPIFATQRVTDLLAVDMKTFLSRVLVMKLNDEKEAAAALDLCLLDVTEARLDFLRKSGPRRGGKGVPSRPAMGIFRDLFNRHAVMTMGPIPEHIRLAMSTNRTDRAVRDTVDHVDADDQESNE